MMYIKYLHESTKNFDAVRNTSTSAKFEQHTDKHLAGPNHGQIISIDWHTLDQLFEVKMLF